MEDIRPMLSWRRITEYHEAKLEIPETGTKMDEKHMEVGFEEYIHGETCVDQTSIRRVYDD